VAQVVEHLPGNCKAMGSIPNIAKKSERFKADDPYHFPIQLTYSICAEDD
jgi:hypothetical protein